MNKNLMPKPPQPTTQPKLLTSGEGEMHTMLTHTFTWKVTGADTNGQYAIAEVTDTEGGSAPVHSHPWEETFYILEGEMEVQVGEQTQILGAGAVIHIPANTIHAFRICSPTCRTLISLAPASAAEFYRETGEKITSLPPDPIAFTEICTQHDVEIYAA